jgi:AmmeMemoRadiSam system protein A
MAPSSTPPDEPEHVADRMRLLRIARESVIAAAARQPAPPLDLATLSEWLRSTRASFVTLTHAGALRGCIGALQAAQPLALDVQEHAAAAATQDYRFPPVTPDEVETLTIEVSVLTPPETLAYASPEDLLRRLRPSIDGVILSSGLHRATFLPQVWEHVPDPAQFLSMLCDKARLPHDAWRGGDLEVATYQVESFEEQPG